MLSDCIALICVLQVEASSELEPLSCHSTEDPLVSLPRRCFVCYAFSPQTSPRLLKDLPICFPNTLRSFETAVSLFRTSGETSRLRCIDARFDASSRKVIAAVYERRSGVRCEFSYAARNAVWQRDRLQRPIKIVASAIVIQRILIARWCATAMHNLLRHVDDFTWQMYRDSSLINVELNGGVTLAHRCLPNT